MSNPDIPQIPKPDLSLMGLGSTVIALIQAVESLAGNRGKPGRQAATFDDLKRLGVTSTLSYLVGQLPANGGPVSIATNGRNSGQGANAGTGCLVFYNPTTRAWCAVWSGLPVTA